MNTSGKRFKQAAALEYQGSGAPILVAKGEGDAADVIIGAGRIAEIPILEDKYLSNYLQDIPVGEEVPEILFESVAIVLSWAYWMRGKFPELKD